MPNEAAGRLGCPMIRAVGEVGDGWSLLILWAAVKGVRRFDGFQRELGVARNVLSERLRRLTEAGLLRKVPIAEGARRMEYLLTDKGRALETALRRLHAWGELWADARQEREGRPSARREFADRRREWLAAE